MTGTAPAEITALGNIVKELFEAASDDSWYAPLGHPFAVVLCSDGFLAAVARNSGNSGQVQALSARFSTAIDTAAERIRQDGGTFEGDIGALKTRSLYKAACCVLGAAMKQYDPAGVNYHRCNRWKS